jgi:hypothetical protein
MDVLINGVAYDASSVIFEANGQQYISAQDISYGSSLKPGELRGTAKEVIATTAGEAAHKFTFSLSKQEASEYMASLGAGYGLVKHDIVLRFRASGSPESKVESIGVRVTDKSGDIKGTDAVLVKFETHVMRQREDGLSITDED